MEVKGKIASVLIVLMLFTLCSPVVMAGRQTELPITRGELSEMIYNYEAFGLVGLTSDAADRFPDTADCTDAQKNAIGVLIDNELVLGNIDGLFYPESTITRAEAVMILFRTVGEPLLVGSLPYEDVAIGAWYYQCVAALYDMRILEEADMFRPNDDITRTELQQWLDRFGMSVQRGTFAELLYNYEPLGYYGMNSTSAERYEDLGDCSDSMKTAIGVLYDAFITTGTTSNTYSPNLVLNRAQAATYLYRALGSSRADESAPYSDIEKSGAFGYAYNAISFLYQQDVLEKRDRFEPADPITMIELVRWLDNCEGILLSAEKTVQDAVKAIKKIDLSAPMNEDIETVKTAVASVKNLGTEALAELMTGEMADQIVLIEQAYQKVCKISVDLQVENLRQTVIDPDNTSIVGAALNVGANSDLRAELRVTKHSIKSDVVSFRIAILENEKEIDADPNLLGQQLEVPVKITMPVPDLYDPALLALYYEDENEDELIELKPSVYMEKGEWYLSFVVNSLGTFEFEERSFTAKKTTKGVRVELDLNVSLEGRVYFALYDREERMIELWELSDKELAAGIHQKTIACDSEDVKRIKMLCLNDDFCPIKNVKSLQFK